jgi:hypothetical protein
VSPFVRNPVPHKKMRTFCKSLLKHPDSQKEETFLWGLFVTVRTLFTQKINKLCFAEVFASCKHRPNLDFEDDGRRVPLNNKSNLIHEWMGYAPLETWKRGSSIFCMDTAWSMNTKCVRLATTNIQLSSCILPIIQWWLYSARWIRLIQVRRMRRVETSSILRETAKFVKDVIWPFRACCFTQHSHH